MGVFKQFATNRELEEKGIPIEFSPNPDGTVPQLVVRRVHVDSPRWQAALERVTRPYKAEMEAGTLSEEVDKTLMMRVAAESAVIGWSNWRMPEGVAGGKGEGLSVDAPGGNGSVYDIPFSADAVYEVFKVLPDLWRQVIRIASDSNSFKKGDLETIAKNW